LIPIVEDEGGTCDYNQPHLPNPKYNLEQPPQKRLTTTDNGTFLVIHGRILISQACLGMILPSYIR
jgi:hypothetical protein